MLTERVKLAENSYDRNIAKILNLLSLSIDILILDELNLIVG